MRHQENVNIKIMRSVDQNNVLILLYQVCITQRKKTCLWGEVINISADKPAYPHSLISAYFNLYLGSIISKLVIRELSMDLLVSVAEETG